MFFRQLLNDDSACASYLFGCKTESAFAVADPHADLVDDYIALAERQGMPIVAVLETHVHADHLSGLPELVAVRAPPPTCLNAPASSSTTARWPTARSSGSATPRCARSRRQDTRAHTTRTS